MMRRTPKTMRPSLVFGVGIRFKKLSHLNTQFALAEPDAPLL
jgi:hypothetical protein